MPATPPSLPTDPGTHPAPYGTRSGARTTQRRGRMSDAKRNTLATLGPTWLLDPSAVGRHLLSPAALERTFGRVAPVMLDIGVGTGAATLAWAAAHPDHDVVAVELHRPGIALLLQAGHAAGLTNVRVLEADVTRLVAPTPNDRGVRAKPPLRGDWRAHLGDLGPDHPVEPPQLSLNQVRVLFPDPWPKKRHVGRRLVDVAFVRHITDILAVGGTLHLATDWPPYADQMRAVVATEPRLEPQVDVTDPEGQWRSHRPDRPVTPYERRGLDAGRPINDLIAHRSR